MNNTLAYRGYVTHMEFDPHGNILVGRILDIDDIVTFHGDAVASFTAAFHASVDEYLAACKKLSQEPNGPASNRRMPPTLEYKISGVDAVGADSFAQQTEDSE